VCIRERGAQRWRVEDTLSGDGASSSFRERLTRAVAAESLLGDGLTCRPSCVGLERVLPHRLRLPHAPAPATRSVVVPLYSPQRQGVWLGATYAIGRHSRATGARAYLNCRGRRGRPRCPGNLYGRGLLSPSCSWCTLLQSIALAVVLWDVWKMRTLMVCDLVRSSDLGILFQLENIMQAVHPSLSACLKKCERGRDKSISVEWHTYIKCRSLSSLQ
jgi:hypothetical protein